MRALTPTTTSALDHVTSQFYHSIKALSRAEGGHKELKAELGTNRGDLYQIIAKFGNLLRRRYHEITTSQDRESMNLVPRFGAEIFSNVIKKVSVHALSLVLAQYQLLFAPKGQSPPQLPPCQGLFNKAYGFPCVHTIERRRASNERLKLEDFHSH